MNDPLERDVRRLLDDVNTHVNRECDKNSWWPFTLTGTGFHWRVAVHLGEKWDAYRIARVALRKAVRGVRRAMQSAE